MRNGINKIFLTSLFVIFGLCFNCNYTHGVTARLDCARDPWNASRMVDCYDVAIWETIEFTDVDSTIWNWFKFSNTIINDTPVFVSTNTLTDYIAYVVTFFIWTWYWTVDFQDWWTNYVNHAQYNYIRTWSYAYCTGTTDQWNTCYQRNFTKTYEEAQERVDWLTLSWYTFILQNRLNWWFYANTYTYQICATYVDSDRYLCINVPHANWNAWGQCITSNQCNYTTTTKTTPWIDASFIASLWPTISPFYVEENTTPTPVTWSCPTIQDLINAYPTNYNTWLCYSSSLIISGGTLQTVTPSSIFELFPSIQEFWNYINLYNNYCTNANTTTACQTAFDWNQDKYTLIAKLPNETNRIGIYQYCHYQLNIENKNTSTCVMSTGEMYATGVNEQIAEEIENQNTSLIWLIEDSIQNIKEIPTFNTWYVFDELLDDGETRTDGIKLDVFKTFLLLWSKITTIFYFRNSQPWIIPEFITTIIIIIVLFKLFKK